MPRGQQKPPMGMSMPVQTSIMMSMGGAAVHPPLPKAFTEVNPEKSRNLGLHGERVTIVAESQRLWAN